MRPESRQTNLWLRWMTRGMATLLLIPCAAGPPVLAQSSVEKSETTQQSKQPDDSSQAAQEAVRKGGEKKEAPETGRILGNYSVSSSIEVGYRFVDTDGSRNRYRSEVNVRDGLRLLESTLDMRSLSGTGGLFDSLRSEFSNLGGDQAQLATVRIEKTRAYIFDARVRRLYYYRFLPSFGNNQHNFDVRRQAQDYFLKLFPQRKVRINIGYDRMMSKGPFTTTYDYERDEFGISGTSRWSADDYRLGVDATYRGWTFLAEGSYRYFRNDTLYSQPPGTNAGNNTTNTSVLTFFERDQPYRVKSPLIRASAQGTVGERLHIVLRALHVTEHSDGPELDRTMGTNSTNSKIVLRDIVSNGFAKRPNTSTDAGVTYDLTKNISVSNTLTYYTYKILGDVTATTRSTLQAPNGTITNPVSSSSDSRSTDVNTFWNTLDMRFSYGRKVSANIGWRFVNRDVTLRTPASVEEVSQDTNSFIGGFRYRPTSAVSLLFDVDHGTRNNAFVRVNPLDYTRYRVRANLQAKHALSFTATFTSNDTKNPTPFVENSADYRTVTGSVNWEPGERAWLSFGYNYDYLFSTADIAFTISGVLNQGRSVYYARQNVFFADGRIAVTKRLDLLFVYRYLRDRGAPADPNVPAGPNNFVSQLPLRRHNPEARLAYRFSNHVTGNVSYRHYSYNERLASIEDYRANILTTSVRWTF